MKNWIRRYATCGLAASRIAAIELFGDRWEADRRFKVLHYGIGLESFQNIIHPEKVREELAIPVGAPVVGHVGSFIPRKNHKFILDIAQAVFRTRPEVRFLFVGDGTVRPEIEARAKAMGISESVHFCGIRTDVPRLMRCMNALVMPSLWEGLPMTLIEAQAAGLPCIASDSITQEAKILPGRLTLLSLSTGPAEWAEQIITALDGGTIDERTALKAIAHSDFSIERSTTSLSQVYAGG
jgi:glycosyltransferase involved in cell wall biosynthesis